MKKAASTTGFIPAMIMLFLILFCSIGGAAFADSGSIKGTDYVAGEVLARADSQQHAEEIAAGYSLSLKSYAYGVAVLATPDPEKTVAQSKVRASLNQTGKPALPELSLNNIFYVDEILKKSITHTNYQTYNKASSWQMLATAPYGEAQWHHWLIDSERAWSITKGNGVIVAVIDTGIDINHPKFAGRILPNSYNSYTDQVGTNYVIDDHDESHGTHVSGIIAASMEGVTTVCGIAPQVEILVIKANMPHDPGKITQTSWIRGLEYAVENGADIVNLSFGHAYYLGENKDQQDAIKDAVEQGVLVVCAAGNTHANHADYPAAYPEAIAVSALNQNGVFDTVYSNYGPEIDVAAPGTNIYSTARGGGFMIKPGTSMAAPCVTATAALIKSIHPSYTPQQIRDIIYQTAIDKGAPGKDQYYGWGVINTYAAVRGNAHIYAGKILYQPSTVPATVELFDSTNKKIASEKTAQNGTYMFSLPTAPQDSPYKLIVTKPGYLSYTINNFDLSNMAAIDNIDISPLAGDINGDGVINSEDLTLLLSAFNKPAAFYPKADIDGSGMINAVDLAYLLAGFNKSNVEQN